MNTLFSIRLSVNWYIITKIYRVHICKLLYIRYLSKDLRCFSSEIVSLLDQFTLLLFLIIKSFYTQFPSVILATLLLTILVINSRKKTKNDPTKVFTAKIQTIVPTKIIDNLRSLGMIIHEGQVPPTLKWA